MRRKLLGNWPPSPTRQTGEPVLWLIGVTKEARTPSVTPRISTGERQVVILRYESRPDLLYLTRSGRCGYCAPRLLRNRSGAVRWKVPQAGAHNARNSSGATDLTDQPEDSSCSLLLGKVAKLPNCEYGREVDLNHPSDRHRREVGGSVGTRFSNYEWLLDHLARPRIGGQVLTVRQRGLNLKGS